MTIVYSDGFEMFWSKWRVSSPSKKGSKKEAFQVWDKMKLEQLSDEICRGVDICVANDKYYVAKSPSWKTVQAWKHACRWLEQMCWDVEDEAEIERDKRAMVRAEQIEKKREADREQYTSLINEYLDANGEEWTLERSHKNGLQWLVKEIVEKRNENQPS